SWLFPSIQCGIDSISGRQSFFCAYVKERVQRVIGLCDAIEVRLDDLAGSNLTGVDLFCQLRGSKGGKALGRNYIRHLFASQDLRYYKTIIFDCGRLIESLLGVEGAHDDILTHRSGDGMRVAHRLYPFGIDLADC